MGGEGVGLGKAAGGGGGDSNGGAPRGTHAPSRSDGDNLGGSDPAGWGRR